MWRTKTTSPVNNPTGPVVLCATEPSSFDNPLSFIFSFLYMNLENETAIALK
jgi:hypothetical protein